MVPSSAVALNRRILPVDRLVAGYNLLLTAVWLSATMSAPHARWIAAAHTAAAALPILLARAPRYTSGPMRALRLLYPLVLLAAFWPELDLLRPALARPSLDGPVAALDRALFGVHLHAVWLPSMPQVWFSEIMYLLYSAYYPLVFLPPLVIAVQGRWSVARDMTFRLAIAYLACFVVFMNFPVDGPHFLWELHDGPHTRGLFYRLNQAAQAAGDSLGCSFPSSHVVGAVTIAFLAWRWLARWVALVFTVEAAGVFLATTYTQNHYAIDSVAGLVYALALQLVAAPLLSSALMPRRPQAIPIFPDFANARLVGDQPGGGR